ncbi:MAG TPA: tetratricopeptide repeat protein, partial [Candidatus Caenarcaniphilales bacterium]
IGMPGHFLIRPDREEIEIFVDAFHGGEILFVQDCQERLAQIYGHAVELQPEFLAPIRPYQFLLRMLTNLKHIYLKQNQIHECLAAIERILLIFPNAMVERRDRGILYYQLGRWTEACQDLEDYLADRPEDEDAALIRQLLSRMGKQV